MITADEAAKMLGTSRRAIYDLSAPRGPIPCYRYGRRCLRYQEADIVAYLQSCRQTQVPPLSVRVSTPMTAPKIAVSGPNSFERRGLGKREKLKPRRPAEEK